MSGILNTLLTLLEPGDEVIVTDPTYAGILNRIRLAGGVPVFVPLVPSLNGWSLDLARLKAAVSPRTKVVLMSPGFPHGHVFTREEWEAIAQVCREAKAWLLYDAALERILYDGRQVIHPASIPDMAELTITVGSASKELRMIGWRVGWVVGPEAILHDIGQVNIATTLCQSGFSMAGVTAALSAPDDGLQAALGIWQERRDVMLQELAGLPVAPPHGGWSLLLDAEALGLTSTELSRKLLAEAKIATTPMLHWGPSAARYLRFVFSNESTQRLLGMGTKVRKVIDSMR